MTDSSSSTIPEPALTSPATGAIIRPPLRVALVIMVCMSAIYFFSFFQRVAVPGTIFDELKSEYGVPAVLVTGLSTLYLSIYGGMQFIAGVMNDRIGSIRVILLCGLLLTIGSLCFPLAPSIGWLYAARALVGLGASLAFISLVKELDYLFPPLQFPIFLSIAMFLGYAGGLVGTLPFAYAVNLWGWRMPLLWAGGLCGLALIIAYLLFHRTGSLSRRIEAPTSLVFGVILRNRLAWPLLLASPANFAVYFLLQSTIGKKFLQDFCGISGSKAAIFTFEMMLVSMVMILLSGFCTRLAGNRRKPLINIAIAAAFSSFILLLWGLHAGLSGGWFLFCYLLLAFSNMGSPIANVLMKELNPPEAVGTATGLINGLCYVTVAVLAWAAGFIMDLYRPVTGLAYPREAYITIFLVCAVISLGTLISSFFLRESYGHNIYDDVQAHSNVR